MTATDTRTSPDTGAVDLSPKRGWRQTKSRIMTGLMALSFVVVALPLLWVVVTLLQKGLPIVLKDFPAWFTDTIPVQARKQGPGMGPAIVGTLLITGLATIIAVPLGVLGAVYLHEYGGRRPLASTIRFMSQVMTGVPSIVMGLFIYVIFTLRFGLRGVGGSLALACLMLPVVIRSCEEMLRLVPDQLREGAYALGTTKSRTVLTVVLPAALPGIVSGSLLAVARAAGETAPLLFTIGLTTTFNWNVFVGPNTALSAQIFTNATSPYVGAQQRAWGAALTLVAITFLFTIVSRAVAARFAVKR